MANHIREPQKTPLLDGLRKSLIIQELSPAFSNPIQQAKLQHQVSQSMSFENMVIGAKLLPFTGTIKKKLRNNNMKKTLTWEQRY